MLDVGSIKIKYATHQYAIISIFNEVLTHLKLHPPVSSNFR